MSLSIDARVSRAACLSVAASDCALLLGSGVQCALILIGMDPQMPASFGASTSDFFWHYVGGVGQCITQALRGIVCAAAVMTRVMKP